jgi:hypothetical protein
MNDKAEASAKTKNAPGAATPAAPPPDVAPSGWVEAASDRLVYKPEMCRGQSVKGILMARVELPEGPNGEPWHAYIIRCTQPTLGVDREDQVLEVPTGQEILLPETFRLADLRKAAENLAIAWEVWIKPKGQVPLGQGKKMWTYRVFVNPKSAKRTADQAFFLGSHTTGAGAAPQLGAGGGANGEGIGRDAADTPF